MFSRWNEHFLEVMDKGGPVMWVLLAMSVASVAMVFERTWFWAKTNNSAHLARVRRMEELLRQGDWAAAKLLSESDTTVYGRIISTIARDGSQPAVVTPIVEAQRNRLDRYMGVLSTMITAGPLVGLLGTVVGLILTFQQVTSADPRNVSLGLSEALFNTVGGLVVALVALFPYNAFRVQIDRTVGRIESILAAAGALPRPSEAPKPVVSQAAGH